MRHALFTWRGGTVKGLAAFSVVGMALVSIAAHDGPAPCRNVNGHYAEHTVAPSSCPSPVGLCIEGEFSGAIRGAFASTATSFAPTADTPLTAVVPFTGDGTIHVNLGGGHGDLFFKSAGAFHTVGKGEIVDLQFITGGTGAFVGASGALRASGMFDPVSGSGESEYSGTVCERRSRLLISPSKRSVVGVVEEMVKQKLVTLIVPRLVLDEFRRLGWI